MSEETNLLSDKKCPQCGNEVSKLAFVCPQCGFELVKGGTPPQVTRSRPLGVWILTLYLGLSAGVIPIIGIIAAFLSPQIRVALDLTPFSLILSILLGIGVLITAVLTWMGNDRGRIAFLALITIHYLFIAFNNAVFLLVGEGGISEGTAVGRILRGFLYPAVTIWYFTRPQTLLFFKPLVRRGN